MIEIINHLHAEGYPVTDFVPDSKIHRFEIEKGDRRAGFYVAHRNYLIRTGEEYFYVQYGSWKHGQINSFTTLKGILTPDDKKNLEKQLEKDKKKIESDKLKEQEITALEVEQKWNQLSQTKTTGFEYLTRKQISECENLGVRYDNFNQEIYVPLRDHKGKLWSLQRINRNGEKRFYPGGRTRGCYHVIGNTSDRIYLTEGLATAASISLAICEGVICVFSAHNLVEVSGILRRLHPEKTIIICADKDEAGEKAAKKTGLTFLTPTLKTGTDWNDLHCQEGLAKVKEQLQSLSILPVPIEAPTHPDIIYAPYPDESEKTFKKKDTIANIAELLRRLQITVRYNVISKKEVMLIPGRSFLIDNQENAAYAEITSWCKRIGIPTDNLTQYMLRIAEANPYNPVASWIESNPWDGKSRLSDLYETIQSTDEPLKETLLRTWLISCVAAAYEPNGISAHGVLVFQGFQGYGKTAWFKKLAPAELEVIADGMFLKPDDPDSVFQAISKWIIELGELDATFKRSDIAQLKAFLTKDKDIIRRPYAKKESNFARRTIFFGSVNENDFLKDPTGNRRFWTIGVKRIDYQHCIDMQQLWAEIRELYLNGDSWIIDSQTLEKLNEHNKQFQETDPIEERIEVWYDWENPFGSSWKTATEVCMEIGILNPTKRDTGIAATVLFKKCQREKHRKRFLVPIKKSI